MGKERRSLSLFTNSSLGFTNRTFMTTHSWGEDQIGEWILEIHNDAVSNWRSEAKFSRWSLKLYGRQFDPNSEDHAWYDELEDRLPVQPL